MKKKKLTKSFGGEFRSSLTEDEKVRHETPAHQYPGFSGLTGLASALLWTVTFTNRDLFYVAVNFASMPNARKQLTSE